MNPTIVDRMYDETSASFGKKVRMSKREFKSPEFQTNLGKNMALFALAASVINDKKNRNIKSRKLSNFERRKQHKVRYDTWRRPEMPTEEDIRLENIHYANFLGDKYCDNGAPYNTEYPVNVRFCDSRVEAEEPETHIELDSLGRRANELDRMTDSTGSFSYVDPYAYIAEYAEDDDQSVISELSLGSNSDLWSLDGGDREFCPADDSDAVSERIATAFKEMHEQTMLYEQYYKEQIANAIAIFNEYENINKRDIGQAYDEERVPESAFKRARCDDESYNV